MNDPGRCLTCMHYDSDDVSFLDGICQLSMKDNEFMQAGDGIQAYDPFLMVSESFGCNQYEYWLDSNYQIKRIKR